MLTVPGGGEKLWSLEKELPRLLDDNVYLFRFVGRSNHRYQEGFRKSKQAQKNEIGRRFTAQLTAAGNGNHRADHHQERNPEQ